MEPWSLAWDGNDFQKQSEAKYMGVSIKSCKNCDDTPMIFMAKYMGVSINGGIQTYCWFMSWTIQSKWMIWG
jgi:hypothetical protein